MQAILTTYHGLTDHTESRIVARCDARRKTFPYDHALDLAENHACAAKMLAQSLGWLDRGARLVSGSLPGTHQYAHVLTH